MRVPRLLIAGLQQAGTKHIMRYLLSSYICKLLAYSSTGLVPTSIWPRTLSSGCRSMRNTSSHYLFLSLLSTAFRSVLSPGCVIWRPQSTAPKATSLASRVATRSIIIHPLIFAIDITMYRKASNSLPTHNLLVIFHIRLFIARPGYDERPNFGLIRYHRQAGQFQSQGSCSRRTLRADWSRSLPGMPHHPSRKGRPSTFSIFVPFRVLIPGPVYFKPCVL